MHKIIYKFSLIISLFTLIPTTSCNKNEDNGVFSSPSPIASFNMDKTTAETGEVIAFTNTSQNATSYEWDFGDGNSSMEADPTHSYSNTGTFTITLNANGEGRSNSSTKSITITAQANPLLGKWNLISGIFNDSNIENLSGYREFGNEDISGGNWTGDSKCSMTHGNDNGYVRGAYEISGDVLIYGYSFTSISWTGNTTNFSKFGVVGLGLQNVDFLISGSTLTITGQNDYGTTVLIYEKE